MKVTVSGAGSCWSNRASLMVGVDARYNSLEIAPGFPLSNFLPATNFVAAGTNAVWDDVGDANRHPPGVATQRFYRLWSSP